MTITDQRQQLLSVNFGEAALGDPGNLTSPVQEADALLSIA